MAKKIGKQGKSSGKRIVPEGRRFKPGQSGNPKGRPPKLIHHITAELKEQGYEPVTETQIIDAYNALMQLPEEKVKDIQDDKKKPFFLRLVAKWLQSPRGMEMLDRIMDRSFGKVLFRQSLTAKITTEQPLFPDVVVPNANPEQEQNS